MKLVLEQVASARAKVVVGNAAGTDKLVQKYLTMQGYQLTDSGQGYLEGTAAVLESQQDKTEVLFPLPPSFCRDRSQTQQQYTSQVAPVIAQILNHNKSYQYQDRDYSVVYKAQTKEITLIERQTNQIKMIAQHTINGWRSLPLSGNSSGLTAEDVANFQLLRGNKQQLTQKSDRSSDSKELLRLAKENKIEPKNNGNFEL
jgi:hypothetical protein